MLRRKLGALSMALLLLVLLLPAYFSLVSSSTGYIRINSKSASAPNQQVAAGGNMNLYFGDVTWSGSEFRLLISHDLHPQASTGDAFYTPNFLVSHLINPTTIENYTDDNGAWLVGDNWINGTIAPNIPIGNYTIKAFDYNSASAATTDTFIMVYSLINNTNLLVSPSSGPGGVAAQLIGSGYPSFSDVTIAYFDPTFGSWNPLGTATANASGMITYPTEIPDLGKSVGNGDYPETYTQISYRTEINGIVYGYADYNQYARGLKRVGNQTANGLYGNGTSFASTVNVKAGDNLTLSGKWFHPSDVIYIKWDGFAVVGTVTSDEWQYATIIGTSATDQSGSFETHVTIPSASTGEHYIAIVDSETRITITVYMALASLQVSPPSGAGGVTVQFTGSGYPVSTPITISYLDGFFGSWNSLGTTNADATGRISYSIEVPDLRNAVRNYDSSETYAPISFRTEHEGTIYGYVDYNEYYRGLKRVGNQTAYGLYGNGTDLTSNVQLRPGDSLTLWGEWFHPGYVYVKWDGAAVVGTVTSDQWRYATIIGTTVANQTGYFTTAVTIPTAANVGEHYISVEDSETNVIIKIYVLAAPAPTPTSTPVPTSTPTPTSAPTPTPSPAPTPTPTPTPPQATATIDVSCRSTTTYSDFKVEIKGSLSLNGTAISGAPILISYSITGGSSWESLTLADTGSDGKFLAVWMPSVTGNYLVKATWEGNSTINGASAVVNLAVMPYAEQNVFSVSSNSTISEFAFNSASKELSFTASGPSGTTGYVTVYIPKSLITDVSSLKVYLDGSETTYATESQGDAWLVSFSYQHSSHKIVLALSAESSAPLGENTLEIIVIAGVLAAVVAIAAVLLVTKKRRQKLTANSP
jgi:hypothetical protein